jgi:hypothetical protein
LQSQFRQVIEMGMANGHTIEVKPRHRVVDIRLRTDDIQLTVSMLMASARTTRSTMS